MNFCPTKYEKYAAALRTYLQRRIEKQGINEKTIENLKKIYVFECMISDINSKIVFDGLQFFDALFSSICIFAVSKGAEVRTEIRLGGELCADLKKISVLCGMLCSKIVGSGCIKIRAEEAESHLIITVCGIALDEKIKKTAALFKATVLCELFCKKTVLIFPIYKNLNEKTKYDFTSEIKAFFLFAKDCL